MTSRCTDAKVRDRVIRDPAARQRLLAAFELSDAGIEMTRARLARQHPDESAEEISARLVAWLRGAPPPGTRASSEVSSARRR